MDAVWTVANVEELLYVVRIQSALLVAIGALLSVLIFVVVFMAKHR